MDNRHLCGVWLYQRVTPGTSISPVRKQDQGFPTEDLVLSCNCLNIDHFLCENDKTNPVSGSSFSLHTVLHLDKAFLGIHPKSCKKLLEMAFNYTK